MLKISAQALLLTIFLGYATDSALAQPQGGNPQTAATRPEVAAAPVPLHRKIYPIQNIPADEARARLRNLLPEDLARLSLLLVDPKANDLFVQGPKGTLEIADRLLPPMQHFNEGVTVGVLPPNDVYSQTPPPRNLPPSPSPSPDPSPRNEAGMYRQVGVQGDELQKNRISQSNQASFVPPAPVSYAGETDVAPSYPPALSREPAAAPLPSPAPRAKPVPAAPPLGQESSRKKPDAPPACSKVYRCVVDDVVAFEKELYRYFGDDPTITFTFSEDKESRVLRVVVLASEDTQLQFGQTLREMGVLLSQNRNAEGDHNGNVLEVVGEKTVAQGALSKSRNMYVPRKVTLGKIERVLQAAFGRRLIRKEGPAEKTEVSQESGRARYDLVLQKEELKKGCTIEIDFDNKRIVLEGDRDVCEQMVRLIQVIDQTPPPDGIQRKIIPIRAVGGAHNSDKAVDPLARSRRPSEPAAVKQPIRQVVYKMQQDESGGETGGFGGAMQPFGPGMPGMGGPDMGGFGAPGLGPNEPGAYGNRGDGFDLPQTLNIVPLPALDIILFEGTGAELKRLQKMITDIEELMQQSQAELFVYNLKNTDCISMNEMIADVFRYMSFLSKQGAVQLFPLRNPNAILLVGWGKAFEDMKALIETLDQPISEPGSRWKAIRLQYVPVTYADKIVKGMFPTVPNVVPSTNPYMPNRGYAWLPRIRTFADQRTNSLLVEAGKNDMQEVERLLRDLDIFESGPQLTVKSFKMRNSLAADLAATLTQILSPGATGIGVAADTKIPGFLIEKVDAGERRIIESGILSDVKIVPDARNNVIVVTAPQYAMPLIEEVITMLDIPSAVAQIKIFQIFNGDAKQLLSVLTSIIPAQLQGQLGPQLAGTEGEDKFVPLRFSPDSRTNTIIATGAEKDLKVVEALINRLDSDDADRLRTHKVYQLKNAQASDIAQAIQRYMSEKRNLNEIARGAVSPYLQLEEMMIVIPEPTSNSLIIETMPKHYDEVEELIMKLDRAPDQVMIQVLIAEVTCSDTDELGMEFGIQDSILFNRSTFDKSVSGTKKTTTTNGGITTVVEEPIYVPAGDGSPGFLFNDDSQTNGNSMGNDLNALSYPTVGTVAPQLLTNFATGRVNTDAGFGGMVFSASSDAVNIMIRALQETKRLEILSRPQIMAMDNQLAFILIGEKVPRVAGGVTNSTGYTSNVEMEEVGLMLMVTPRISPERKVLISIGAEKSKVGNLVDGIPIPNSSGGSVMSPKISAITAMTQVSAADNETVVLGGLLTKDTQKVHRQVPLLGDIPVLGKLFQYNSSTIRKTELLIILTPRIISSGEDAERVKREEAARMSMSLRDVVRMHGSPSSDIGIWDATAEQPVTGGVEPVYPAPVLMQELTPIETPKPQPIPRGE